MAANFPGLINPRAPTNAEWDMLRRNFPNIGNNVQVLGNASNQYNCLGWVVGDVENYADPDFWRDLREIFQLRSLRELTGNETAQATVVVYSTGHGPQHVAKLVNNQWTSKLGDNILISHDRDALHGTLYGTVQQFYGPFRTHTLAAEALAVPAAAPEEETVMASSGSEPVTQEDVASVLDYAALTMAVTKPKPKVPSKPKTPAKPPVKPAPLKPLPKGPPKTTPKTQPKPSPSKPTTPAQGSPAFEKAYTAWEKTWTDTAFTLSSSEVGKTQSSQYKALIGLKAVILPQLAAKLTVAGNDYAVIPYKNLDTTWKKKHPKPLTIQAAKAAIIKDSAATHKRIAALVQSFAIHKDNIITSGLKGVSLAAQLMTDPLFQSIVKEGGAAAAHIIQQEASDPSHHSGIWTEMLKQIHAIEQHGLGTDQEKQEFEQWLNDYLAHSTAGSPSDEEPSSDAEATPASDGEQSPTAEASGAAATQ